MQKRNSQIQTEEKSIIPDFHALDQYLNHSEIDTSLAELVRIRASQLNKCGSCTDTHIQLAKKNGENEWRIKGLTIWHERSFYSDKERAALAWTEALTRFLEKNIGDDFYNEVSSYLSTKEIEILSTAITSINHWKQQNPGESKSRSI